MTERNVNLLLSDAAQPTNGLATTNVIQWYGGPFSAVATGVFDAASVEVMICVKAPKAGDRADYVNTPGDYDWVSLHTFTDVGTFSQANLNPCALAIQITGSVATTRVAVQVL